MQLYRSENNGQGRLGTAYEIFVGKPAENDCSIPPVEPIASPSAGKEVPPLGIQIETELERAAKEADRMRKGKKWFLLREAGRLLPRERVRGCSRNRISKGDVEIWSRNEGPGCFYGNLQRCASVWVCPCCAARITERRRKELKSALEAAKALGWKVFHVTFTAPHHSGTDAKQFVELVLKARTVMRNRTVWRGLKTQWKLEGYVRALETLYGRNGPHAHIHELLFCAPAGSESLSPCDKDLLSEWQSACVSVGLPMPDSHGVKVQDGTYAAKYVGKWGLEYELTKAHTKKGLLGGRTPFDLLEASMQGDSEAGLLFQKHHLAFKGKKQLVWSKGLRGKLGLTPTEKTDQELVDEKEENATKIGGISIQDWNSIKRFELRADVLYFAENYGWPGVEYLIQKTREFVLDLQRPGQGGMPRGSP